MDQQKTAQNIDKAVTPEMIGVALDKIRKNSSLARAQKLQRLLEHLIKHTLASNSRALSAFAIGTDCLGLRQSFDPNTNPHVRVTIGRLRKALEAYYLGNGKADPVQFEVPKGGTRVTIRLAPSRDAHQAPELPASSNHLFDRLLPYSSIDGKLRDGFYDCMFPSFTIKGKVMAHLMKISALERSYRFKSVCRMPNPSSGIKCLSSIKFVGEILQMGGKYFCIYAEFPNPSMVAFLTLEGTETRFSGTSSTHQLLIGVNTALSADRARSPLATPVALSFLGQTVEPRSEISRTGYFDTSSDRIPDVLRPYFTDPKMLSLDVLGAVA